MEPQALVNATANSAVVSQVWNEEQVRLVAEVLAKDANLTPGELVMFAQVSQRTGLDPFRKQIYAVRYKNGGPITFQTGIDGFRVIAKRSGKLRGILAPEWCGEDGEWREVWLDDENPPVAARVAVRHSDYDDPVVGVALYREYVATRWDKDLGQAVPNSQWQQRPAHMLAKCAEALAIRRAFPDDVGGLYSEDEMEQAGNVVMGERYEDVPVETVDEDGVYVEQAEIFGADEVTEETLVDHARLKLREYGLDPRVLRQIIPNWEGGNVREGLANWARKNPNLELLDDLTTRIANIAITNDEAQAQAEEQALAQDANDAAEAEQASATQFEERML